MIKLIDLENFTGIRQEKGFIPSNTFGFAQDELTKLLNPEKKNNDYLYNEKFNLKKDIFNIEINGKIIEIKEQFSRKNLKTTNKFTFVNGNVVGVY